MIHADIDPAEIGKNRHADVPIVGDAREVIADLIVALQAEAEAGRTGDYEGWVRFLEGVKERYPLGYDDPGGRHARAAVRDRSGSARSPARRRSTSPASGQHQMWAAQFIGYEHPQTWINSGGPGHDGLRGAGRDGRQGRRARTRRCGRSTATAASR